MSENGDLYNNDFNLETSSSQDEMIVCIKQKRRKNEKKKIIERKRLLKTLKVTILTLFFASLISITILQESKISEMKYRAFDNNAIISDLEEEISFLEGKIESAIVIGNVESYAISELGMQYPLAEQIIYLEDDIDFVLTAGKSMENTEVAGIN